MFTTIENLDLFNRKVTLQAAISAINSEVIGLALRRINEQARYEESAEAIDGVDRANNDSNFTDGAAHEAQVLSDMGMESTDYFALAGQLDSLKEGLLMEIEAMSSPTEQKFDWSYKAAVHRRAHGDILSSDVDMIREQLEEYSKARGAPSRLKAEDIARLQRAEAVRRQQNFRKQEDEVLAFVSAVAGSEIPDDLTSAFFKLPARSRLRIVERMLNALDKAYGRTTSQVFGRQATFGHRATMADLVLIEDAMKELNDKYDELYVSAQ